MGEKKLMPTHKETEEIVESLKACSIFADLPKNLLEKIAPMITWHYVPSGTILLSQNQINTRLFFLVKGTLGVFVDDEQVSVLKRTGDVIGEMSVISSKEVSATIKAQSEAELFSIEAKDFSGLSQVDAQAFQHTLYRVFALILTEKLANTNNKARDFEIANRQLIVAQLSLEEANTLLEEANRTLEAKVSQRTADLKKKTDELVKSHFALEQRNTALRTNQKKIEEVNAFRRAAVERIDAFIRVELAGLGSSLASMNAAANGQFTHFLSALNRDIDKLKVFFDPLNAAHNSEVRMAKQKVLLLEPSIKEQVIAKMALGGTGVELDIAATMEAGRELIEKNHYDIVFTGMNLVDLTKFAQEKNPEIKIVFMTSESIHEYLIFLERYPSISNVVSFSDEDRTFTIKNITTTVSKLANQDLFGLEKYISWGTEVSEIVIVGSAQRRKIVSDLGESLLTSGIRKSVISRVTAVAEELLMNAIYDAPVDKDGKSIYNHLSRTVKIELKSEEQGLFRHACDGLLIAISVTDPFGGLTRETIVTYLRNCYGASPGTLNFAGGSKGGAGLGLFQLIATSDLVVFNVNTGRKTEVIALFSTDPKVARVKKKPSFHFFYR
jgi:CRP-like cAMP-binding protein